MACLTACPSGVRYDQLDAFKRACQQAARTTAPLLKDHGYAEPATVRGESSWSGRWLTRV